jgi:hypothetical protein
MFLSRSITSTQCPVVVVRAKVVVVRAKVVVVRVAAARAVAVRTPSHTCTETSIRTDQQALMHRSCNCSSDCTHTAPIRHYRRIRRHLDTRCIVYQVDIYTCYHFQKMTLFGPRH